MRLTHALLLASVVIPSPALAGEEVLYGDIPDWVRPVEMDVSKRDAGPAAILYDWQYRLEDGVVYAYTDTAMRFENPQSLMQAGTLSFNWLPDNGDITVHRLEILRAGESIDLLADGVKFDVLRREQALEQRMIDGELTATLAVPGLRVGDILRYSYSTSNDERALGDEVQAFHYLPSAPWQVGYSQVIASWPVDEEMYYAAEERVQLPELRVRDGYKFLELELPLAERDPAPRDAPFRFRRPDVLRIGSFASWEEVSSVMAPHFTEAAQVADGSPVAQQADAIIAKTTDPLERVALATQLVQDEVAYLFEGLDGGGYMPQSAADTWEVRYGDCKAKSVLLMSLLRRMGIESEVVLVNTEGGDAVPELLPLPAFNHMIVHAVVGGQDYWLDGTSSASRLANIGDVLPFYYALPLRAEGVGLMEMKQRDLAEPQMRFTAHSDHSAGVDFPMLMKIDLELLGAAGAPIRAIVDSDDPDALRRMARSFASSGLDGGQISSIDIDYDEDKAIAHIQIEGVSGPEFYWEDGRLRTSVDQDNQFANFNPDRARPSWRDIPVMTSGPSHVDLSIRMKLPDGGLGFTLDGPAELDTELANTRIVRDVGFEGDEVVTRVKTWTRLGEIAAEDLPEVKRAARRLDAQNVELVPPQDVTWRWELSEKERMQRAKPIIAAYEKAVDFADEDDFGPLQQLAQFRMDIYDFAGAKEEFNTLIEEDPSAWAYYKRAFTNEALGDLPSAISDMQSTFDLEPSNGTGFELARMMAYDGQAEEARDLLESLPVSDEDRISYAGFASIVFGLADDVADAQVLLADEIADQPQNASILNSDCWFRGLFSVGLDDALEQCTRAVERADNEAPALDSRALVQYRLGNLDAAISDLDTALQLVPDLAPSIYLRGLIRLEKGDREGQRDIDTALGMAPNIADMYARHGLAPRR